MPDENQKAVTGLLLGAAIGLALWGVIALALMWWQA